MLPGNYGARHITGISVDGKESQFTIKTVKGYEYAFVTVEPGSDYAIQVKYGN